MLEAFDLRTAHQFGDGMFQQARLRYDVFVRRRGLSHNSYRGLEYDEFDTPGAIYLVWRDEQRVVRGLVRLLPTTLPYMLQSYWPALIGSNALPQTQSTWEVTRVCVDPSLPNKIRRRVLPELFSGVRDIGSALGIRSYLCVTRPALIDHVLRSGLRQLGPIALVEGEFEAAFEVTHEQMMPSLYCQTGDFERPPVAMAWDASVREAA